MFKLKKIINRTLGIMLLCINSISAQNPLLMLPPNTYTPNTLSALPTVGVNANGYHGVSDVLSGPFNIYPGPQNKAALFVIQSDSTIVYNKNGYTIGDLLMDPVNDASLEGRTQTVIIPDPANCQKYYILGGYYDDLPNPNNPFLPSIGNYFPYYTIVDMSQQTPGAPIGEKGKIVYTNSLGGNVKNMYDPDLTPDYYPGFRPLQEDVCIAVTKLRKSLNNTDHRFIFIWSGQFMYVYKLTMTGPSTSAIQFVYQYDSNDLGISIPVVRSYDGLLDTPCELEIYEDNINNTIKVALAARHGTSNWPSAEDLFLLNFNYSTGQYQTGTTKLVCVSNNCAFASGSLTAWISGIEFSPDGNYVYFTHTPSNGWNRYAEWVQFSNPIANRGNINPANIADFQYSQIETGLDGKLYFPTGNRLAVLSNPNNPASWSTNWNNSVISLSSYPLLLNPSTGSTYMLNDQIDQETYGSFYNNTIECCKINTQFDIERQFTFPSGNTTVGPTFPQIVNGYDSNGQPMQVIFNSTTTSKADIIIPIGAKVTFQNLTMQFTPDAGISVMANNVTGQQGGKLTLSSSVLTAYTGCDPNAMWPGVMLNGLDGIAQGTATNSQQPVLVLSFSSQIDHALTAIKMDHGAIAQVANSRLYDNRVAIEATTYSFASATDVSLFSASVIKTLSTSNIGMPSYLVNMVDRVPVMRFQLCTFGNESVSYHNTYDALISNNSAVTLTNSNFTRFRYAVRHSNTSLASARKLKITNNTFNNNNFSVAVSTSDFAEITASRFNIIDNTTTCQWPYGLLLDGSSKFKISGNTFNNFSLNVANVSSGGNQGGTTGLIAQNTNLYDINFINIIEKNTFLRLHTGLSSTGRNYSPNLAGNPYNINGLRYYCNIFQNNLPWFDMLINGGAIDYNQGVATYRAQNEFSHSGTADIYAVGTDANTSVLYNHSGTGVYLPTVNPYPYILPQDLAGVTNTNDCSGSAVGSPGGRMMSGSNTPLAYHEAIHDVEAAIGQLKQSKQSPGNDEQLAFLNGQRDKLKNELVLYYLNDSLESSQDSARKYRKEMIVESNNPYQLISFYLDNGNPAEAKKAYGKLQTSRAGPNSMYVYGALIDLYGKDVKAELTANKDVYAQLQAIANDESDVQAFMLSRWLINKVEPNAYTPGYIGFAPETTEEKNTKYAASGIYNLANYPNPFSDNTTITAYIPEKSAEAAIKVTDVSGREISSYQLTTGTNTIDFNHKNSKGILFYTLYINGKQVETKIMVKNN